MSEQTPPSGESEAPRIDQPGPAAPREGAQAQGPRSSVPNAFTEPQVSPTTASGAHIPTPVPMPGFAPPPSTKPAPIPGTPPSQSPSSGHAPGAGQGHLQSSGTPMASGMGQPQQAMQGQTQPAAQRVTTRRPGAPALSIIDLRKAFGAKVAVADLSMAVPRGCLFGLVGPNGAGKTTTLSMATGLLRPDAGRVIVGDADVWVDPARAKALMGVLPDGLRLFDRLSGRELLTFVGQMRRMDDGVIAERSEQLLATLGLADDADTMVADYSAGMTKKIGLACALIHRPQLLVLDEPFESVDPVSGETIREILHQFVAGGGTVVLSSHVMELVETLCDAVAVIASGRLLAIGDTDEVRQGKPLQQRFLELVGVHHLEGGGLSWLEHSQDSN